MNYNHIFKKYKTIEFQQKTKILSARIRKNMNLIKITVKEKNPHTIFKNSYVLIDEYDAPVNACVNYFFFNDFVNYIDNIFEE